MFYNLTNRDGEATISVFLDNGEVRVVPGSSLSFGPLLAYLTSNSVHDEEAVENLVDPSRFIGSQMKEIAGDRVTYDLRDVYFDGRRLMDDNLLGRHIKQKIETQDTDWKRLVKFLLNLDENPSRSAQRATYEWVSKHGLTLTEDGCFVGYKAVTDTPDFLSSSRGPNNYIDGVLLGEPDVDYQVPHKVGSVISKKRADVDDTPGGGCSVGLHVGTYEYAIGFAPVMMTVKVNPRDVVSAPGTRDGEWKIRVCRYEVVALNAEKRDFIGTTTSYDEDPFEEYDGLIEDDSLDENEAQELEEAVQALSSVPEDDEDPMDALADWERELLEGTEEAAPQEHAYDSLAEAEQAGDQSVLGYLHDTSIGHKPLAKFFVDHGHVITTESSVRRWRKAHGIVLG